MQGIEKTTEYALLITIANYFRLTISKSKFNKFA